MASTSNTSSHQQVEEFAPSAIGSTSGGSTMPVKELDYSVFLSYSECRLGRAIYKMAIARGLKLFQNSEKLGLGDQELEAAIENARWCFVIFSVDYAQSRRCLKELLIIRRKSNKIVPIFKHVKPSIVRYALGVFADAVDKSAKQMEELKRALRYVSDYSGHVVNSMKDEYKLLKKIDVLVAEESAPSTSTSMTRFQYDVYISYCGRDNKKTLAKAIYKKLKDMGLKNFMDTEKLRLGDYIPDVLQEAMKSAKLHIAILSENYAQTPCCLEELSIMLQTGTRIVPCFYNVKPEDVRDVRGVYAAAFDRHEEMGRYTQEKLGEWKETLRSVSYYFGFIVNSKKDKDMLPNNIVSAYTRLCIQPQFTEHICHFFLNHRGPDSKDTLAKDLYEILHQMGWKVFLDTKEFKLGDHIPSVLERVVKGAKIHIAIFSENYAESQWCLDELSYMVETGTRIIPIYFNCKREDVRDEGGVFGDALNRHKRLGQEERQKLKKILRTVTEYPGLSIDSKKYEDVLPEIIRYVLGELIKAETDRGLAIAHCGRPVLNNLNLLHSGEMGLVK